MDICQELDLVIRARYPLLYLISFEEERVVRTLAKIAADQKKEFFVWTRTGGLKTHGSNGKALGGSDDPLGVLEYVERGTKPALYLLKDYHHYFRPLYPAMIAVLVRKLRDLTKVLQKGRETLVFLSPVLHLPPELSKEIVILDFPLPTYGELGVLLDRMVGRSIEVRLSDSARDRLLKAALGLTEVEAARAIRRAIQQQSELDEACIELVQDEKKQIIRQSGILEYYTVAETLDQVGGLEILKRWLVRRTDAFTLRAQEYGLPQPKGLVLLGIQGCGKSLVAKTVAAHWHLPLLRMDVGRVFGGLVGESEAKMRQAITTAEAVSPCILWIDELDKAFGGVRGFSGDSGTQLRVFGSFITWLQEKTKPVFVIATANNPQVLPAELLRKGRFDEIFFVDLPSESEREDIFTIHLQKRNRWPRDFDLSELAAATVGFSGAEIEQLIVEAMHEAFADGERPVTTQDILKQIHGAPRLDIEPFVPLSKMMKEDIQKLRKWTEGRARRASRV